MGENMDASTLLTRQGQRLLQVGMLLLLLYSYGDGFVIPVLASPRIGLSVHTLSVYQGVFVDDVRALVA